MDLSKAFDTLNHDLLLAKLEAYGFETDALRYMKRYLTNRKQRVRVNKTSSEWGSITIGMLQGSTFRTSTIYHPFKRSFSFRFKRFLK